MTLGWVQNSYMEVITLNGDQHTYKCYFVFFIVNNYYMTKSHPFDTTCVYPLRQTTIVMWVLSAYTQVANEGTLVYANTTYMVNLRYYPTRIIYQWETIHTTFDFIPF